jgi:hypothetical protein
MAAAFFSKKLARDWLGEGLTEAIGRLNDILLLFLGWLLGTLSPGIGRAILSGYRRRELLHGLSQECIELRFTLAVALFGSRSELREMDVRTLQLIKPILVNYEGADDRELVEIFRQLTSDSDDQVATSMNERPRQFSGQWPMPYDLPLLDAHLGELTLLPIARQEQLMRVRAELNLFNEQVAYVRHLVDRSFEVTGPNHAITLANLEIAKRNLAVRSEALIRTFSRFLARTDAGPRYAAP